MFERFTERARAVVMLASDEARNLRHRETGTEHLVLGLIREEHGFAARVLIDQGVTYTQVLEEVTTRIDPEQRPLTGQMPFSVGLKKVLELGLREALSIGDNYIGTEHLLLGLMRHPDSGGAAILYGLGVKQESVLRAVIGLRQPGRREEPRAGDRQSRMEELLRAALPIVLAETYTEKGIALWMERNAEKIDADPADAMAEALSLLGMVAT